MSKWSKSLGYDSDEEVYFSWWLDELVEVGYIREYYFQQDTFALFSKVEIVVAKRLKTKWKNTTRTLLQAATYTCDFTINWSIVAFETLFQSIDAICNKMPLFIAQKNNTSFIDVKPIFEKHQSRQAKFSLLQKAVYEKYQAYVQPIIYQTLFKKTFTPKRYFRTDKSGQLRKIKWELKTLEQFINLNH